MTRRQRSRRSVAYIRKNRLGVFPWRHVSIAGTAPICDGPIDDMMTYNCGPGPQERPTRLNPSWPRESCDPIILREERA